jgi:perosamine synthetase
MKNSINQIAEQLLQGMGSIMPRPITSPVSLHEPAFFGNELKYITECIETGWVSSVGKYVDLIELKLCEITGSKYAIAMVNGTAALHIAFILAGVRGGDEVLLPSLTFIATANAATYCGATPHFVDSNEFDLGICPIKLESYLLEIAEIRDVFSINKKTGKIIRALCVTHIFGLPAQLKLLKSICDRYHITLIEDAAEALGSYYEGKHVGHYGLCGIISFNGNKITTTGGGGALLTNSPEIARCAKHLSTTAKIPAESWEYRYDAIGYNYRMPNINAALGCAQLENLFLMLEQKRKLAERYRKCFQNSAQIDSIIETAGNQSNYWLNAVRCAFSSIEERNHCLKVLNESAYCCRPIWELLTDQDIYRDCPKMNLDIAQKLVKEIINLPSGYMVAKGVY